MSLKLAKHLLEGVAQLVYPVCCPGCGSDGIQPGQLLCLFCNQELPYTGFTGLYGNPIEKIFRGRLNIQAATSLMYFSRQSVIRRLLHQLKYEGNKEIGLYFGRRLGEVLLTSPRFAGIDFLVPLPLHHKRQRRRGFNQATILCEGMSEVMDVPIVENLIVRSRATETQTFRSRTERWQNIEEGFQLKQQQGYTGKHLLLIDDVITTGATLEACGSVLQLIPNLKLSIATLAFTIL